MGATYHDVDALLFRLRPLFMPSLIASYGGSTLMMTLDCFPRHWSIVSEWADVRDYLATNCPLTCPPEWIR